MSKRTALVPTGLAALVLLISPIPGWGGEIGIALDSIPIYAEPTSVGTVEIARLAPGSEVILGEKLCTEREVHFMAVKGWVQDFSIVPVTGQNAKPEKILDMARFLEQRGTPASVEGAKALYTAVINYRPGTDAADKATERMAALEKGYRSWVVVAAHR